VSRHDSAFTSPDFTNSTRSGNSGAIIIQTTARNQTLSRSLNRAREVEGGDAEAAIVGAATVGVETGIKTVGAATVGVETGIKTVGAATVGVETGIKTVCAVTVSAETLGVGVAAIAHPGLEIA
jgi:hypothetical protein